MQMNYLTVKTCHVILVNLDDLGKGFQMNLTG